VKFMRNAENNEDVRRLASVIRVRPLFHFEDKLYYCISVNKPSTNFQTEL